MSTTSAELSQPSAVPSRPAADGGPPHRPPEARPVHWLERLANAVRHAFDRLAARTSPVVVASALALLALGASAAIGAMLRDGCDSAAGALIRLEVAFRAAHFAELMPRGDACRAAVIDGFSPVGWDTLFALAYAAALAAAYVWAERWRRFHPYVAQPLAEPDPKPGPVAHAIVLAPLAAGLLDMVLENVPLWRAATLLAAGAPAGAVQLHVAVGSVASALKWTLLLVVAWGIVAETLRGPRGEVLRRARFSVLAVVLGAFPLLVVPQGQDVLQRLAESYDPRTGLGVVAIGFAALTAWYCARKLVQFAFEGDQWRGSPWYAFFAEQIPRIVGVAALVVSGAAFARAGLATGRFGVAGGLGVLAAWLVQWRWGKPDGRERALPTRWRDVPLFRERMIGAALAIALGALVVYPHWLPWERHGRMDAGEQAIRALRFGAWMSIVAAWLLYLFVYYRRAIVAVLRDGARPDATLASVYADAIRPREPEEPRRGLLLGVAAGLVVSAVLLALFTVAPVRVGRAFGPLWILALAVANAIFFGSIAVWVHRRWRVPVVTLGVAAAVLFSLWNENHVVRTIPAGAAGGGAGAAAVPRATLDAQFDDWFATLPDDGAGQRPVILVAAAGGGLRAAYWTASALAAVQDQAPAFGRHVFAISGVSGGSLGAATFVALLRDAGDPGAPMPCADARDATGGAWPAPGGYSSCVRRFMRDDFLSPVLAKLVAPDFAQRFLPVPIPAFDRSTALEGSWERSYDAATRHPTFARGLVALSGEAGTRTRLPVLLLNATHVETGKRFVASPVRADAALADAPDVLAMLGGGVRDLPLSAAVHNSARFTFVSPAGYLQSPDAREHGRLVDGGYFEASGLTTIQEVYAYLMRRARETGKRARFVVLYLCNEPRSCNSMRPSDSASVYPKTMANELFSPPRAVLAARDARGRMSMAQLETAAARDSLTFVTLSVCERLEQGPALRGDSSSIMVNEELRARARARVVSPPLGWLLSGIAREWMDGSLAGRTGAADGCQRRNAQVIRALRDMVPRPAVQAASGL